MRVRLSIALLMAAVVVVGACSNDDDNSDEAATTTTAAEPTTTAAEPTTTAAEPTTTTASLSPPEPGEPNTASIVFEDGEPATVPVTCNFDPGLNLAYTAESDPDADPNFGMTGFTDMSPQVQWLSGDSVWVTDPNLGGELVVDQDAPTAGSSITGTGVFVEVEANGSGTPTGEQRAGAFTVLCAE